MRRIILSFILCMVAVGAFAYNESVAAIAYNPSRLGQYNKLRATTQVTLAGGLNIEKDGALNIASVGTVLLQDDLHACGASGSGVVCTIPDENQSGDVNYIKTVEPAIINLTTSAVTDGFMLGMNKMGPNTGNPLNSSTYQYDTGTQPSSASWGTNINMTGGALTAMSDSYIHGFSGIAGKLEMTVSELLNIMDEFRILDELKLGEVTIKPGTGARNYYEFVPLENDNDNKQYKVLVVK